MYALGRGIRFLLGLTFALCLFSSFAIGGNDSEGVLVLYNNASNEGLEIANYYAQVHPGVRLLGLNLDGYDVNEEQISDDYYLNVIRPQVLSAIDPSVDVIVTTKGMPLRICVDDPNPGSYTDPSGVTRVVGAGWWKPYSSLESELTRIDVVSTWQQMGDQTYFDQAGQPNCPQATKNPYYPYLYYPVAKTIGPFDYGAYAINGYGGMRLTSRLDGFTAAQVETAIDKAQQAYLIPNYNYVVLDDDPNSVGGDRINQLKSVLNAKSQRYVYNNTDAPITTASGPVIGYVGHGVNDGAGGLETGYIAGQLNFKLANGAIFQTHESYNAYSFQQGDNMAGQGLVAEWLAIGGTAGVGHVYEPMSGRDYEANEDQIYKMLLSGYTWAEAAWSSMQQLSYVNTVVGDPLMTWKRPTAGAITYPTSLIVGDNEGGFFFIQEGGFVVTPEVRVLGTVNDVAALVIKGGTLQCEKLTIGASGIASCTNGTLDVENIEIQGFMNCVGGTLHADTIVVHSGGALTATSLVADTLIIGLGHEENPDQPPTIKPSMPMGYFPNEAAAVVYTGTTRIQGEFLLIDTPGIVELNDIVGDGDLLVSSSTTLIAHSINVGALIIGGSYTSGSSANPEPPSVPEPNSFFLLALGVLGWAARFLSRKKRPGIAPKNS
jgi:hypothetical protein